jgi:MFS transporter, MFS domain-containing protein family, molybdate-anion transporter
MWVPTLLSQNPPGGVPTGCVFSALMMAITMGGLLFPPLQSLFAKLGSKATAPEASAAFIYLLGSVSMAVPALCLSGIYVTAGDCFTKLIVSFLVMEFSVGLFMPVAGTLRSKYVPDSLQGAILNIFRLPLNAVVVAGTFATDHMPHADVYKGVSACLLLAAILQASLIVGATEVTSSKTKKE